MWSFLSRSSKSGGQRLHGGMRVGILDSAAPPEASMRRPTSDTDYALTLETDLWLLRLPPKVRPLALIRDYPRVANRLARDWPDAFLRDFCFEDLLVDRRGGRRGFPPEVQKDIVRLQRFSERHGALIDEQQRRQQAGGGREAGAGPDSEDDVEWTPSETIVVTAEQLRR